ncbi:MAG: RES family NAD+ phosphorylase [Aquabacterium sp.]|jgi:hypothetical protein|uniref:RES family NAD+ phosphorylase n=1 Tax=Aquabacterium sp. TaxID=1872578 RepID=UPI003BAF9A9E
MGGESFIDWRLGTQAQFNSVVPIGSSNEPLVCRRPGLSPLSDWSRVVGLPGQRTRVDDGQSAYAKFQRLSNTDKLGIALRSAASSLGPEMQAKAAELMSATNLAIMAGALAIWIGAHATPVGWVVDIGMVGLGVVALGYEAVQVMKELQSFAMGVVAAKSEADLMAAGKHLSKAIAIVGVDVVVAILLKKAMVKVRQPATAGGGSGGGQKLFGKYDSAARSSKPVAASPSAAPVAKAAEPKSVWHATTSEAATHGVLKGVDTAFLNPKSRFGKAFYVAEPPGTTLDELAHHGAKATQGIRYELNPDAVKVLDLTKPDVAAAWGYKGGPITPATQSIGIKAQEQGFNVIRFYSERSAGGVNNAVLDDFSQILKPVFVTPVVP